MLIRLRKIIVLLLVLALPTQGFAAVGMLACASGHAQPGGAPVFDATGAENVEVVRHEHGAHSHGMQNLHHADDSALQADTDGSAVQTAEVTSSIDDFDGQSKSSCSACASCCFGAALVSDSVLPDTPDLASTLLQSLILSPVSFLTGGPSRPPRFFLA